MIDPKIVEKIIRGEHVRISIVSKDDKKIDEVKGWLQQFNRANCGGKNSIGCNIYQLGDSVKLEVRVDDVPLDKRALLAGTIDALGKPEDSPFMITEKTPA